MITSETRIQLTGNSKFSESSKLTLWPILNCSTNTINFGSNNDKELPSEGWKVIKCIHECNQSGHRLIFHPEPICQKLFVG